MKNKKLSIILAIVIILVLGVGAFFFFKEEKESDALRFKKEYEALNNTTREGAEEAYNNVDIPEDNPIKYVTVKETMDLLNKDQAIIYVGAHWCPWCRNAITVLFDVAKKYNVDTIYYLNLDDYKSSFEIQDGELVKTKDGTKDYYKLLDKLDSRLINYVLTDKDGNKYDTNEKRIYNPYVIAVKEGSLVLDHVGTVSLDENQSKYSELTKEQYDELFKIYDKMFEEVYGEVNEGGTCNLDGTCD